MKLAKIHIEECEDCPFLSKYSQYCDKLNRIIDIDYRIDSRIEKIGYP